MSELENIENSQEVETIPTDNSTEELQENVEQSTSDNELAEQERLQRELKLREQREQEEREREEAEEKAREQARIEHENFLKSFPDTTVFYQEIREEEGYKWLAGVVTRPETADKYGILENHVSVSDLVIKKGRFYLKGYENPDQTVAEIIKQKGEEIDRQLEELLDKTVHDLRRYKNIETCIGYFNSTNEKWRKEAREANAWRDDLYKKAEEILEKVKAGEIDYNEVDLNYIVSRVQPLGWEPEDIFE